MYCPTNEQYILAPAYDMLSTSLVIPDDKEELALTLNGKKRKLKRNDFEITFAQSGLNEKVIDRIFFKFEKSMTQWLTCIEKSFLNEELKEQYRLIILDKWKLLS